MMHHQPGRDRTPSNRTPQYCQRTRQARPDRRTADRSPLKGVAVTGIDAATKSGFYDTWIQKLWVPHASLSGRATDVRHC